MSPNSLVGAIQESPADDHRCQPEEPAPNHHCHCEERSDVAIRSLSAPSGGGRCAAPQGMRIATGLRPRNDAVFFWPVLHKKWARCFWQRAHNISIRPARDTSTREADFTLRSNISPRKRFHPPQADFTENSGTGFSQIPASFISSGTLASQPRAMMCRPWQ